MSQNRNDAKRPYQKPVLTVHGDVLKITQKVGASGKSDGGVPPVHKTGL